MRPRERGVELGAVLTLPVPELCVALGKSFLLRARAARLGRAATRLDGRRYLPLGELEEGVHGVTFRKRP